MAHIHLEGRLSLRKALKHLVRFERSEDGVFLVRFCTHPNVEGVATLLSIAEKDIGPIEPILRPRRQLGTEPEDSPVNRPVGSADIDREGFLFRSRSIFLAAAEQGLRA